MSAAAPRASGAGEPIYLDYAATTPVDRRVVACMLPWLAEDFGNPASGSHAFGWRAQEAVEHARAQVAALIGAEPAEIVWTSGATESDNLALKGALLHEAARGRHLVTVATEHKAVLDVAHELRRQGCELTLLDVCPDGLLDLERFRDALRPDTVLASVMLVNNETGVVQDVEALGAICRERGVLLHVDAAQASGKLAIDLRRWPVDLMSLTAHKSYGPKGIGALYVRRKPRVRLAAQMHGGGHERGLRSGTLPTHQCVGMGAAFALAAAEMDAECARMRTLQQRLLQGIEGIGGVRLNGHPRRRVPHNVNVSFEGIEGPLLLESLTGVAASSGSACSSASLEPSHVLRALGLDDAQAHASLRLTMGRFTTAREVDDTVQCLQASVARLRGRQSPI
ncbi:MAG TPA: IscS subfamily cysteine desulfurase [Rubrivivax sp.]|nr:IscS subfamily cysteine desulfurase [Burkholderiales bacterium]HNT39228.1 IscS subfamily cysteine desulfurase [Rubrivivax sp.]